LIASKRVARARASANSDAFQSTIAAWFATEASRRSSRAPNALGRSDSRSRMPSVRSPIRSGSASSERMSSEPAT
jgi:hypothetical protein